MRLAFTLRTHVVPFSPKERIGTTREPLSMANRINPCLFLRTNSITPGLACNDSSAPPITIVIAEPGPFFLLSTQQNENNTVAPHNSADLHSPFPELACILCTQVTGNSRSK